MGAVKDIYDIAKNLISSAKKLGNHELAVQAIEMYEKLVDMKKNYQELEEKYNNMINEKEIAKRIERKDGNNAAYYTDENGNKFVICTCCWDNNRKIIQAEHWSGVEYKCPVCRASRHIFNR